MIRSLLVLSILVLASCTTKVENPRSDIDAATVKFVSAFNAGDVATVASLYTEGAALLPPGSPRVDGRAGIQDFWQGAIDGGLKIETLHAVEVDSEGDIAGEVGVFTLTVPGDGGPTKVDGDYIVIWKRTGDTWQLHRDIWNTK